MDQYYLAAHADLALERWNAGEKVEAVDDLLGLPGAAAVTVSAMLMGYLHRDAPAMHELVALLVARCADLPEPVCTREAIDHVLRRLLDALCQLLQREQRGARRLMLHAYRVDGIVQSIGIGTSLANRNPVHLFRLYRDRLDGIDPGFGIETMLLEASDCEMLTGAQTVLPQAKGDRPAAIAQIVDRLQARLGHGAVFRQQPVESHWPERSLRRAPPFARWHVTSSPASPRPVSLLPRPEPVEIETNAAGWPSAFRWHRVLRRLSRLEGPERLAPEWWRDGLVVTHRDYFRAEDAQGRRYWLFREQSAWFLHGLFA